MALKSVAGPSPLGPIPIQPHTLGNRPAHFYHPGPEDPPGTNGSRIPYANIIISGHKWVPDFLCQGVLGGAARWPQVDRPNLRAPPRLGHLTAALGRKTIADL